MKAIERHRQTWQGKSDEWIFERIDNELKQKIEEIHRLLAENEALRKVVKFDISEQLFCDCEIKGSSFQLNTGEICCCKCEKERVK